MEEADDPLKALEVEGAGSASLDDQSLELDHGRCGPSGDDPVPGYHHRGAQDDGVEAQRAGDGEVPRHHLPDDHVGTNHHRQPRGRTPRSRRRRSTRRGRRMRAPARGRRPARPRNAANSASTTKPARRTSSAPSASWSTSSSSGRPWTPKAALDHLTASGHKIDPADLARLTRCHALRWLEHAFAR